MKLTLQLVFVVFDAHTKFCDNMVRFSFHCLTSGFCPQTQKTRYNLDYQLHNSLWQWVNHYHKWTRLINFFKVPFTQLSLRRTWMQREFWVSKKLAYRCLKQHLVSEPSRLSMTTTYQKTYQLSLSRVINVKYGCFTFLPSLVLLST